MRAALHPAATDVPPQLMDGAAPAMLIPAQHHFLGAADIDRLLLVIDSSLKVRLRHHFFRWTQGAVQSLLPHDGLICVIGDARGGQSQVDFFTSMVIAEKDREFMQRQHGGLYADLLRHWRQHDRQPLAYSRGSLPGDFDPAMRARLSTLPFARIIAHGIGGPNGEISCFFGLLGACGEAAPHHSYLMELVLPYFHAAWLRVLAEQPLEAPDADLPINVSVLTGRQIEIMRWVHEGKSNIEIGLILGISALTVKNHVQKILRKLNVQNRTQAVAKCMSHRIFKSSARS